MNSAKKRPAPTHYSMFRLLLSATLLMAVLCGGLAIPCQSVGSPSALVAEGPKKVRKRVYAPKKHPSQAKKESAKNLAKKRKEEQKEAQKAEIKPSSKGHLPPLREMITSHFGERRPGGPMGIRIHQGLDIRAHLGWPVIAFSSGEVRKAGFNGRAGILVEIAHKDGTSSGYAHLQTATVKVGEKVKKGDKIGEVGCTGYTTGAHLHFTISSRDHTPVNPLKYLQSADEILRPSPESIPEKLGPQQCNGHIGPYTPVTQRLFTPHPGRRRTLVVRSRSGRVFRIDLNRIRNFRPPEIPVWEGKRKRPRNRY